MATTRFIDIKVRTSDSKREVSELDSEMVKLGRDSDKASVSADKLNTANTKLTKTSKAVKAGIGGVGRNAGMAGIQFQQFIGQVQGGQSAMLALSQQSADLGFVLGAPLLGAVVGIGASVLGMAFAFNQANVEMVESSEIINELVSGYDNLSSKQREITRALITNEIVRQKDALQLLKREALGVGVGLASLLDSEKETRKEKDKFTASILKQELAITDLEEKLKTVKDATLVYNEVNSEQQVVIGDLITNLAHTANNYGKTAREMSIYKAELLGANELQIQAINFFHDKIELLKEEEESLKRLAAAQKNPVFANRLAQETESLRLELELRKAVNDRFVSQENADEVQRITDKLTRNQSLFDAEILKLGEDETAKEELRSAFREQQLLNVQEFQQNLTDIEKSANDERVNDEIKGNEIVIQSKQATVNALSGLLGVFAGKSKAAAIAGLAIQKATALSANATATLSGSQLAFASQLIPGDPTSLARATAASAAVTTQGSITAGLILATGLAQGAGILSGGATVSTSTSLGGGASLNTGLQPTQSAAQLDQTRVIDIRLDDDALLTGAAVKQLITDALSTDSDIITTITDSQNELVRVGG